MFKKAGKVLSVVLMIVAVALGATVASAAPPQQGDKTIVDIAVEDGRFTTLVTAVQAADLVDTLNSDGPFTVFAPTDDAFDALPEGALDQLLADVPALKNVLLYHVVPGKVLAADVLKLSSADTVLGKPVTVMVDGNMVKINDAQVIITDIEASNGVIHVIDAVLLPPADNLDKPGDDQPGLMPVHPGRNDGYNPYRKYRDQGYGKHRSRGHYGRAYSGHNYNRSKYGYNKHKRPSYYSPNQYKKNYYPRYSGKSYGYYGRQGYTRWWHVPRHRR